MKNNLEWNRTSLEPSGREIPLQPGDHLVIYTDKYYKIKYGLGHVEHDRDGAYWVIDGRSEPADIRSVFLFSLLEDPKNVI